MATITDADFTQIRQIINNYPAAKAEMKLLNLDRTTWMATFQAIEDWFVNGFGSVPSVSLRGAIDVVTTATTSGQDQILGEVWFEFKQWKRSQA